MVSSYNSSRDKKIPDDFFCNCVDCGKSKRKIRSEKNGKKYIFRDDAGKRWCGNRCPDCKNLNKIKFSRINHIHKPIDEVEYHTTKKGRLSERIAEKYFLDQGFSVSITKGTGPDLIIRHYELEFTVEVKSATKKKKSNVSYSTSPVSKNRMNDDFICIVMPDDSVFIDTMSNHLKNSDKLGYRHITKYFTSKEEALSISKKKSSKSGFSGVYFCKKRYLYRAFIYEGKIQKHLGYFKTAEEAAKIHDIEAKRIHGKFARLNFQTENVETK